jgi:hypothetical protein
MVVFEKLNSSYLKGRICWSGRYIGICRCSDLLGALEKVDEEVSEVEMSDLKASYRWD